MAALTQRVRDLPLTALIGLVLTVAAGTAAAVALAPSSPGVRPGLGNMAVGIAELAAVLGCLARWRAENTRNDWGWPLLAIGAGLVALGVSGRGAQQIVASAENADNAFAALNFLGLAVLAAGLTLVAGRRLDGESRWLSLADSAAAAAALLLCVWVFIIRSSGSLSPDDESAALLYGYLASAALLLTLALQFAPRWGLRDRTGVLMLTSLSISVITLVVLVVATAHGVEPATRATAKSAFVAAPLLVALAGLQSPSPPESQARLHRERRFAVALPTTALLLVLATVVEHVLTGQPATRGEGIVGLAIVTQVLLRLLGALRERQQLTSELEQRVVARTAELERSRRHFRDLVQHSSDLITVLSREGEITYCSPAVTRLFGYAPEEVLGRNIGTLIHEQDLHHLTEIKQVVDQGSSPPVLNCRLRRSDGTWVNTEAVAGRLSAPDAHGMYVVNVRDVSERTRLEEQLRHQAHHDPLTGLANRSLLGERIRHALARARRTQEPTALLYVDLDHFKRLNDSAGHTAGDAALEGVAQLLEAALRPSDTAARLGGDEFAVLLEGTGAEEAEQIAARLINELQAFSLEHGRGAMTGASVGVALVGAGASDAESLLRDADIALYQAKAAGRGRAALFQPHMREQLIRELALVDALRETLRSKKLRLHLQPIVNLQDGTIHGLEALVRWFDPEGHAVPPALFIPLAEETQLISQIDSWVAREACTYVASLRERCPALADVTLNLNVSATELPGGWLFPVLAESGLQPRQLMVEITETAVVPNPAAMVKPLQQLRDHGVRISLDDFGTGYSSMSTLKHFPLDELKIDGSFVAGMNSGGAGVRLVSGILHMAHALGLDVVAEAVESREHAALLREMGCEYGQGWLFAPAMDRITLERWASRRDQEDALVI